MKKMVFAFAVVVMAALVGGCASEEPAPGDELEQSALEGKADRVTACPQLLILCIEGYHAKSVGQCRQVCVPDHGAECDSDDDCTIYCITTPCPQGECRGGTCRVSQSKPPRSNGCTPTCGAGETCQECKTINGSSMVCLPDGSVC